MGKNNITFVVFTYNEEKRIPYFIKNVINYWEVIVIDNFSEDNTVEVSEKLWAKVYQYKNPWYVETQEELDFVKSKLETEYMTWSFADHMWDKKLLEKTIEITNKWKYDAISAIMIQHHYWVEWLNFMTYNWKWKKYSAHPVVFKKDIISFEWIIHKNRKINYKNNYIINTKYNYHHFSEYNINKFELSTNNYSNIESEMLYNQWVKSSLIKTIFKIFLLFIKYYFFEWAFKKWKLWFIMVMNFMFFYFNVWAKHYEKEQWITLNSISNNYIIEKEKILKIL